MMLARELSTKNVLLVEDNEDHAFLIRLAIEEEWKEVTCHHVSNGLDAIGYLKDPESPVPDLILLDLKMPHMDGHELLSMIKLHGRWRKIPVVMLTTSSTPHDRDQAYQNYANSYIVKPTDTTSFRSVIRELSYYWNIINQPSGDRPMRFPSPPRR